MIYRKKPFEVCLPGLNFHRWNNWVLVLGSRAIGCCRGRFTVYRVAK